MRVPDSVRVALLGFCQVVAVTANKSATPLAAMLRLYPAPPLIQQPKRPQKIFVPSVEWAVFNRLRPSELRVRLYVFPTRHHRRHPTYTSDVLYHHLLNLSCWKSHCNLPRFYATYPYFSIEHVCRRYEHHWGAAAAGPGWPGRPVSVAPSAHVPAGSN